MHENIIELCTPDASTTYFEFLYHQLADIPVFNLRINAKCRHCRHKLVFMLGVQSI